jgi:bifunctional polynucleotide phosphatase/kinase
MAWTTIGSVLVRPSAWKARKQVLFLDLDNTIVRTRSGNVFPRDSGDWTWLYGGMDRALRDVLAAGIGVCVVTNQLGCVLGTEKGRKMTDRVDQILEEGWLDLLVLASVKDDEYRKPRPGILPLVSRLVGEVDVSTCLYVGDAAGRAGDHSCCDRKWALNVGMRFQTPEEFFLSEEPREYALMELPRTCLDYEKRLEYLLGGCVGAEDGDVDLILLVGRPASGKSTLCARVLEPLGYVRVCQDELKTRARCLERARQLLREGTPVVVDSTNGSPAVRKEWVDLCGALKVPIRAVVMETSPALAEHLNRYRASTPSSGREVVPSVAFRTYESGYVYPAVEEGFSEVVDVPFLPHFSTSVEERRFREWYT